MTSLSDRYDPAPEGTGSFLTIWQTLGAEPSSIGQGKSEEHPIRLCNITAFDLESLVAVFDHRWLIQGLLPDYVHPTHLHIASSRWIDPALKLTFEQWSAAVYLATVWGFHFVRAYAVKQISSGFVDQFPLESIELAAECNVANWLRPAYEVLCERTQPISAEEGKRLGYTRLIAICRIRETTRNSGPQDCNRCPRCRNGAECQNKIPPPNSQQLIHQAKELDPYSEATASTVLSLRSRPCPRPASQLSTETTPPTYAQSFWRRVVLQVCGVAGVLSRQLLISPIRSGTLSTRCRSR